MAQYSSNAAPKNIQGTKVLLPAGDVFIFNGINPDSDRNYTTIIYAKPSDGRAEV